MAPVSPAVDRYAERELELITIDSPLELELSQRFDPRDPDNKLSTNHFKVSMETTNLSVKYSNQSPGVLGGSRFQTLPRGYNLAEVALKKRWGSLHGFHSTGYDTRFVKPAMARRLTGSVVDIPQSFMGTHITGYFLHASPHVTAKGSRGEWAPPEGSQAGFTVAGKLGGSFKLSSEWTRSWQAARRGSKPAEPSQGLFVKLSGQLGKTSTSLTYRRQGAGLTHPAKPVLGRGRALMILNMKRTIKNHQFQYSSQINSQEELRAFRLPFMNVHRESLRWSYTPKNFPRLSAGQTWTRQVSAAKDESEETLDLSMNKGLQNLLLTVSYMRKSRLDELTVRPLSQRTQLMGSASLRLPNKRTFDIQYELKESSYSETLKSLSVETIRLDGRVPIMGETLALIPAVRVGHRWDPLGAVDSSVIHFDLSTMIKLPPRFPGVDLLIRFNSHHETMPGQPSQDSTGVTVQWNVGPT